MVKLIWTDQEINDLNDIGNYIAENSGKYANLTVKKLFERADILKTFPQTGRIVPEKNYENIIVSCKEERTRNRGPNVHKGI